MDDDPEDRANRQRVTAWGVPSVAVVVGFVIIVVAAVAFFVSGRPDKDHEVATPKPTAATTTATTPPPSAAPPEPKKAEKVPRAYVEIFNNSRITGLADSASSQAQGAGWKVVGVDNWYGKIPVSTVYYPKRLKSQAELLARDLKVDRVRPAISPMKFDRLTLILTGS